MKRGITIAFFSAMALGVALESWWLHRRAATAAAGDKPVARGPENVTPPPRAVAPAAAPKTSTEAPGVSSAAATAARVAQIKKDYEDMMTRFAAEFTAAGEHFPGGLNAYLRQLALLEREKWKDLSAILTPRELEDLQMQDTHAGQLTRECLANTAATDEQRRAVFRLQQEFDDKWALTFDLSAATLLARQTERQATQEKILALLGPDLFGAWLHGEGSDYALSVDWAARQGFAPDFALNEWRLKSEFELARLQLTVQAQAQRFSREEVEGREAELAQRMRERARAVFGPTVIEAAQGSGRFSWLR